MKMKGTTQKVFILAVGVIVFVLIAGCQESATGGPTDAKKSRLVAAENMELKKELENRDKEIARLKELHSKEIKRQEELLAKCQEEKKLWQEKTDENIKGQMERAFNVYYGTKCKAAGGKRESQSADREAESTACKKPTGR